MGYSRPALKKHASASLWLAFVHPLLHCCQRTDLHVDSHEFHKANLSLPPLQIILDSKSLIFFCLRFPPTCFSSTAAIQPVEIQLTFSASKKNAACWDRHKLSVWICTRSEVVLRWCVKMNGVLSSLRSCTQLILEPRLVLRQQTLAKLGLVICHYM